MEIMFHTAAWSPSNEPTMRSTISICEATVKAWPKLGHAKDLVSAEGQLPKEQKQICVRMTEIKS